MTKSLYKLLMLELAEIGTRKFVLLNSKSDKEFVGFIVSLLEENAVKIRQKIDFESKIEGKINKKLKFIH